MTKQEQALTLVGAPVAMLVLFAISRNYGELVTAISVVVVVLGLVAGKVYCWSRTSYDGSFDNPTWDED